MQSSAKWASVLLCAFLTFLIAFGEKLSSAEENASPQPVPPAEKQGDPSLSIKDIQQFANPNQRNTTNQLKKKEKDTREHVVPSQHFQMEILPFVEKDELCENEDSLWRECSAALRPYLSLLRNEELTTAWTRQTEFYIENALRALDDSPEMARKHLANLQKQLLFLDNVKRDIIKTGQQEQISPENGTPSSYGIKLTAAEMELPEVSKKDSQKKENKYKALFDWAVKKDEPAVSKIEGSSLLMNRYPLASRLEIMDSFRYSLDRRIYLWALAADYYDLKLKNQLVPPKPLTSDKAAELRKKTEMVRNYFGITEEGQKWRKTFEVDSLFNELDKIYQIMINPQYFLPISNKDMKSTSPNDVRKKELAYQISFLYDRINTICYKIVSTPMSPDQMAVFKKEPLAGWVALLNEYSCDQADPEDLLWTFEIYERTSGSDIGEELYRLAWRMKTSHSEACRKFGEAIDVIYDNANAKVYISEVLISRLLPITDPEFDVVNEYILNNPVAGQRRTDNQISIELVPDPSRILMNLLIRGRMIASTSSTVYPATLYNQSFSTYVGRKELEWKKYGILYSPTEVFVNLSNELSGVQTDMDFVPLLGDLIKEVAKGQYELQQPDIQRITQDRIKREVRQRIDQEANARFDATNTRLKERFFGHLDRLGLDLNLQKSRTTEEWILASLRLETNQSLGSQTVEPPTMPGAFADLKVHESTINTFLSRLELQGKIMNVEELLTHLGNRLQTPFFKNLKLEENANLYFEMARMDPITVRFYEDRILLRLALSAIEWEGRIFEGIKVTVSFRPFEDGSGRPALIRDGMVRIDGPMNIRAQILLRSIFSKVFPTNEITSLVPPFFERDKRFTGLSTGLCRISRRWFCISIVHPIEGTFYKYR
ncbi:MAG: hypothetical protein Q4G69_06380 [Planctomycetia bacterium]|nr:hypothetical protein [Planctomycetia bacterium]